MGVFLFLISLNRLQCLHTHRKYIIGDGRPRQQWFSNSSPPHIHLHTHQIVYRWCGTIYLLRFDSANFSLQPFLVDWTASIYVLRTSHVHTHTHTIITFARFKENPKFVPFRVLFCLVKHLAYATTTTDAHTPHTTIRKSTSGDDVWMPFTGSKMVFYFCFFFHHFRRKLHSQRRVDFNFGSPFILLSLSPHLHRRPTSIFSFLFDVWSLLRNKRLKQKWKSISLERRNIRENNETRPSNPNRIRFSEDQTNTSS